MYELYFKTNIIPQNIKHHVHIRKL